MNVTTEQIRNIEAGQTKAFVCEDALAMYSACTLVTRLKRIGMPDGVVNYETQKVFSDNKNESILIIRAMGESDEPMLNK